MATYEPVSTVNLSPQLTQALQNRDLRWVVLTGLRPELTAAFRQALELEHGPSEWVMLAQLVDSNWPNGAHYRALLERADPSFLVVDCYDQSKVEDFSRSVKQVLTLYPGQRLLFVAPTGKTVTVPSYLGRGEIHRFASGEMGLGETDDSVLLDHSRRLIPKYRLSDLILGRRTQQKLTEAIDYIRSKSFCENEWGFKKRHSRGHGVTLVFHGASGTGKTMAAEVVAHTLSLPLYQVDLSSVVSQWIGETEKNLKSVFKAAQGVNGIILFDEGDAIFGKRTEVKGSNDRYANLEVNYLLQELESFEGIVILSTNHEKNMDEAFLRRFTYAINFGNPSAEQRRQIWRVNVPTELPLAGDVDFNYLAQFSLNGGNIRNIIRDAAALAASRSKSSVALFDLMWAMKRELQKKGLSLTREALGEKMWRMVGVEWEEEPLKKRELLARQVVDVPLTERQFN